MLKHMRFAALLLAGGLAPASLAGQTAQAVDDIVQTAVVLSAEEASLSLELADGRSRQIQLLDGTVFVDGKAAGSYRPGGALDRSHRAFEEPDIAGIVVEIVDRAEAELGALPRVGQGQRR